MGLARPLVLASASPRRRELLARLGVPFSVVASCVDESRREGERPARYALRLARAKARAVAPVCPGAWVLGADTVVVAPGGQVLGKPESRDEARGMLLRLAGRSHRVLTACVLLAPGARPAGSVLAVSRVRFRRLDAAEIEAYIATAEPMDKAGAYAVQGRGGALVESVEGSFSNVVGLPLEGVARLLQDAGLIGEERHGHA